LPSAIHDPIIKPKLCTTNHIFLNEAPSRPKTKPFNNTSLCVSLVITKSNFNKKMTLPVRKAGKAFEKNNTRGGVLPFQPKFQASDDQSAAMPDENP
jgi:hypothetical protein